MTESILCLLNSRQDHRNSLAFAEQLTHLPTPVSPIQFHQSIPAYKPTPLLTLKSLSRQLGIKNIFVKDESQRFELKAFKMLGASYAIASELVTHLNLDKNNWDFSTIKNQQANYQDVHLVTATDGNHGRAVAWCAKQFGCDASVYLPKGSSYARLNAIQKFATHAEITDFIYDDTVLFAEQQANKNKWWLIQDTAWQGYTQIPDNIMRGYFSLMVEFEAQVQDQWPTHVFLQAGVGSFAASIAAYLITHPKPTPKIILVEPHKAACFFESVKIGDGKPHRYGGDLNTLMAGLACGEPSISAWPLLRDACDAFISCDDTISVWGLRRSANPLAQDPAFVSGESAAVALGLLETLLTNSNYQSLKQGLSLDRNSKVLLFSTEGDTDPEIYQSLLRT